MTVKLSCWAMTHGGRREENQDAIALPDGLVRTEGRLVYYERELGADCLIVAVADGVGGRPSGRWASQSALTELSAVRLFFPSTQALVDAIARANAKVSSGATNGLGPATTLAGVAFGPNDANVFHVGDSRVYSISQSRVERLTRDHRSTRDARSITRFLGGSEAHATPTIMSVPVETGGAFLISTDGLHDFLRESDLRLPLELEPARGLPALIEMALDNGSNDNLSAIFCRFDST